LSDAGLALARLTDATGRDVAALHLELVRISIDRAFKITLASALQVSDEVPCPLIAHG
jgi:hypothetical protein